MSHISAFASAALPWIIMGLGVAFACAYLKDR